MLCIRFVSGLSLYFTTSGFSSITINLSVPAFAKENTHTHNKKCLLTVQLVLNFWMEATVLVGTFSAAELFCSFPRDPCLKVKGSRVITNSLNASATFCKKEHMKCQSATLGFWVTVEKVCRQNENHLPPPEGVFEGPPLLLTLHLAHPISSLSPFFLISDCVIKP